MGTLGSRHVVKSHAEVAHQLRAQPGVWLPIGEYRNSSTAKTNASNIGSAYQAPMYEPVGSFQARVSLTEMGALVEARYVGVQPLTDDEAWADALAELGSGQ